MMNFPSRPLLKAPDSGSVIAKIIHDRIDFIEGNETAGLSVGKWLTNGTQTQVGQIMTEVVDESR